MNYGANQYKQMAIKTANRGQILIMLYEAAIKDIRKAIDCLDKKDIPGKCTMIGKTHDIIAELNNTLDFEAGGKLARDLEGLYNFMIQELIAANASKDPEEAKKKLGNIQKLLDNLLQGWRVAVEQFNKGAAK